MSLLLKLALSARTRRGVQQAVPAVCSALGLLSSSAVESGSSGAAGGFAGAATVARPHHQQPFALQGVRRGFHAGSATLDVAGELSSVLAKEIKHEQEAYEQEEVVAQGPPAPFKLSTTLGDSAISLTATMAGEHVSVDCSVNMQDSLAMDFGDSDDEDDGEGGAGEEGEPNDVNFNVTVTKGGSALVFECTSDGSYVDIRHVSLEPADGSSTGSSAGLDEDTAFSGPVFGELDDELQNGFRAFLAARGIDDALGEYLRRLMYDKEQQEYMHWLARVKAFVDAKP